MYIIFKYQYQCTVSSIMLSVHIGKSNLDLECCIRKLKSNQYSYKVLYHKKGLSALRVKNRVENGKVAEAFLMSVIF
jgi:phosphomevalonate kinase